MEQSENTFKIETVTDFILLLSITAELFEPLSAYQYGISKGICLIIEEPDRLDSFLMNLNQLEDVEILHSLKTNNLNLPNYKLGIYAVQKYDKAEDLNNFLTLPEFLTAVIVGGSVPENFPDTYKIFLTADSFSYENATNLDSDISDIKDFLRDHPESMENELGLFDTSSDFTKYANKPPLYIQLLISAKMYSLWHRSLYSECETESRHSSLLLSIDDIFRLTDAYLEDVDLSEIFVKLFLDYTTQHDEICFVHTDNANDGFCADIIKNDNIIFYDEKYYFIGEKLFKKMCTPLLNSFRITYIKENLRKSGILCCNYSQCNSYTRKKVLSTESGCCRIRFFWLEKKYFAAWDRLSPEERGIKNGKHLSRKSRLGQLPDIKQRS